MKLDDPAVVSAEYADESRFEQRAAAWQDVTGPDARELTIEAVLEAVPRRVLEVGCGPGWASERIARELDAEVVAVDQSERMVELARARGVDARLGDVQALPFADGSFDCALAAWMLYHVPDLDRGLEELRRVLAPVGRLVATTNAEGSLHELWSLLATDRAFLYNFHAENGEAVLRRHFDHVEAREAAGTVTFPDRDAAQRYVDAAIVTRGTLPTFDGPLVCSRRSVVFVAW